MRAGEAADEALEADDADLGAVDADGHALALEHGDAGVGEDRLDLVDLVAVPVVVAPDTEDRDVKVAAGVGEDLCLLGLAVGGQVAGEEQEVDVVGQSTKRGERFSGARRLAVHVAGGGDAQGHGRCTTHLALWVVRDTWARHGRRSKKSRAASRRRPPCCATRGWTSPWRAASRAGRAGRRRAATTWTSSCVPKMPRRRSPPWPTPGCAPSARRRAGCSRRGTATRSST